MLWKVVHPELRLMFVVKDTAEEAMAWFREGLLHPDKFETVKIEPLTLEDIEKYLREVHKWYHDNPDKVQWFDSDNKRCSPPEHIDGQIQFGAEF